MPFEFRKLQLRAPRARVRSNENKMSDGGRGRALRFSRWRCFFSVEMDVPRRSGLDSRKATEFRYLQSEGDNVAQTDHDGEVQI